MFRDRIREKYDSLTPGFSLLADFIIDNTLEVAFLTASQLAHRVGVDPATVVRFSQEIGYSGYRELSQEIKRFVFEQVSSRRRMLETPSSFETMVEKTCEVARVNFERFTSTELPILVQAAEALSRAECIWVTGEFVTEDLASFVVGSFGLIGLPAHMVSPDKGSLATCLGRMQKDDALLALNSVDPGIQTRDVIREARAAGVRTIAITASNVSPPAREAEISISVPIRTDEGIPRFSVLLLVMGLIWEILAYHHVDRTTANLVAYGEHLRRVLV